MIEVFSIIKTYSSILAGEYIIASEDSSFVLVIFSDIALERGSTIWKLCLLQYNKFTLKYQKKKKIS